MSRNVLSKDRLLLSKTYLRSHTKINEGHLLSIRWEYKWVGTTSTDNALWVKCLPQFRITHSPPYKSIPPFLNKFSHSL